MKTTLKVVSLGMLLAAASISGGAYANCPAELTAEERISCIQIEGAGVLYQDYLVERAEVIAAERTERATRAIQDSATKQQDAKAREDLAARKLSSSLSQ